MPRLREERLAKLQAELERSDLGALLTFDFHNIRYMTGTHIGTWAMDKLIRFALLPRGGKPIVWDFGSAARHHQLYNPWLWGVQVPRRIRVPYEGARAGISTLRGAIPPGADRAGTVAEKIKEVLSQFGLQNEPIGVDVIEMPVLAAFAKEGMTLVDGQQVFLEARRVKTADEISLLAHAASMVDTAYEELYAFLRPGVRENECVGLVNKTLYDFGIRARRRCVRDLRRAGVRRTPTCSAIGSSVRATRRSSTSCTASTATVPATTAPSRWASASCPA